MPYAKRSLFERILLLHGIPYRTDARGLLILDCGTEDGEVYARWVRCPASERELYHWLGY